jgi:hypothetical protein
MAAVTLAIAAAAALVPALRELRLPATMYGLLLAVGAAGGLAGPCAHPR